MTEAAPTRATPPQKIQLAVGALVLAAVAGLAASLSLFGERAWLKNNIETNDIKNKVKVPTDSKLNSDVSGLLRTELLISAVVSVLIVLLARSLWRGRYIARWGTVGVLAIATLLSTPIGLFSLLSISSSAPPVFKTLSFIGALALASAAVLVNLKESVAYLLPTKKPRKPGRQGVGAMFSPRPPRPARPPRGGAPATPPPARKPANTRPLSQQPKEVQEAKGVQPRTKAKTRTSAEPPEGTASTRVRGKSRKA